MSNHRTSLHQPSCFEAFQGAPGTWVAYKAAADAWSRPGPMADSCAKRCAIAQARRTVVLHRRRQKFCFDEAGWHASAPLGVCCCSPSFALAGPGEHSIQPTLWDASPGVVRSPACQASRFLSGFLIHTHLRYTFAPFPRSIRCETAATQSRRWYISSPALPTRVARLARSAPLSRRVG
jgi:hypothetical protein